MMMMRESIQYWEELVCQQRDSMYYVAEMRKWGVPTAAKHQITLPSCYCCHVPYIKKKESIIIPAGLCFMDLDQMYSLFLLASHIIASRARYFHLCVFPCFCFFFHFVCWLHSISILSSSSFFFSYFTRSSSHAAQVSCFPPWWIHTQTSAE